MTDLTFVMGRALYMEAIHGGKPKTDKIDSEKIARLLMLTDQKFFESERHLTTLKKRVESSE